eukprot:COSAG05_NODE_1104_length_5872_cov_4.990473_4_plen_94_part_00
MVPRSMPIAHPSTFDAISVTACAVDSSFSYSSTLRSLPRARLLMVQRNVVRRGSGYFLLARNRCRRSDPAIIVDWIFSCTVLISLFFNSSSYS